MKKGLVLALGRLTSIPNKMEFETKAADVFTRFMQLQSEKIISETRLERDGKSVLDSSSALFAVCPGQQAAKPEGIALKKVV